MRAALCLINCLKREKGAFGVAGGGTEGGREGGSIALVVAWRKEEKEREGKYLVHAIRLFTEGVRCTVSRFALH